MKYLIISFIIIFSSCSASKKINSDKNASAKMNIEVSSDAGSLNLSGLFYLNKDSNFFNFYGPLGINVAKVRIIHDSVTIVDIIHKTIYKARYSNLSSGVYEIFKGNYTKNEEKLICSLYSLIKNDKRHFICSQLNSGIKYDFKNGRKHKIVNISLNDQEHNFHMKLKYMPGYKNGLSTENLMKYSNYKTITIQ